MIFPYVNFETMCDDILELLDNSDVELEFLDCSDVELELLDSSDVKES